MASFRALLLTALVAFVSSACGARVAPLPGVPLCRPPHPPMDLAIPSGCQPCTITYCHGPELPPCSTGCGAPLSCLPKAGGAHCCGLVPFVDPYAGLPDCPPVVKGGPGRLSVPAVDPADAGAAEVQ